MDSVSHSLKPIDRFDSINSAISQSYEKIAAQKKSSWGLYNGQQKYGMCRINEHQLMKWIIEQAYPKQKEFYAIDLGAGNFEWVDGLSYFINSQSELPNDITVHVIGVRGEQSVEEQRFQTERCISYKLGAFKVEELFKELQKQGLFLEKKVDLLVSHFCFCHLVDPVGTFVQAFELVRPERFFIGTGFLYSCLTKRTYTDWREISNQIQILLDTKAPFLFRTMKSTLADTQFILQRPDDAPISLPLQYRDIQSPESCMSLVGSGYITEFTRTVDNQCMTIRKPTRMTDLHGDKTLFSFFKTHPSICEEFFSDMSWQPAREEDCEPALVPPFPETLS